MGFESVADFYRGDSRWDVVEDEDDGVVYI